MSSSVCSFNSRFFVLKSGAEFYTFNWLANLASNFLPRAWSALTSSTQTLSTQSTGLLSTWYVILHPVIMTGPPVSHASAYDCCSSRYHRFCVRSDVVSPRRHVVYHQQLCWFFFMTTNVSVVAPRPSSHLLGPSVGVIPRIFGDRIRREVRPDWELTSKSQSHVHYCSVALPRKLYGADRWVPGRPPGRPEELIKSNPKGNITF